MFALYKGTVIIIIVIIIIIIIKTWSYITNKELKSTV